MPSLLAASILFGIGISSPSPTHQFETRAQEPCAQISSALQSSQDGSVDPDIALRCLKSVPVDTDGDTSQLLGISTFANFQSTLAFLKDPTKGYLYPAVDIESDLKKLTSKLKSGGYSNEYDFQNDIYKTILSAHDGHFNYYPDIIGVLTFSRDYSFYSISKDGISLPEIYSSLDIEALSTKNATLGYSPSPIITINGEDVEDYLENLSDSGSDQDPDANYNLNFPNIPLQANGQGGIPLFFSNGEYPGSVTKLIFKNGTKFTIDTEAYANADFDGVNNGKDFFNKFCTGAPAGASSSAASFSSAIPSATSAAIDKRAVSSAAVSSAPVPSGSVSASAQVSIPVQSSVVPFKPVASQTAFDGVVYYPKPWVYASDGSIACYFPTEQKDLAVISVPTFAPGSYIEFGDVTRECLATARKLGKKKLVVDLRGNGGGNVLMAYDMFKQLFPDMKAYGTTNFRAWTLFNQMGKLITKEYSNTTPENAKEADYNNGFSSPFNADEELDDMYKDFKNWDDFYGPVKVHGDTFTNLVRYNLSDPYQVNGEPISDYGDLKDITPVQVFDAADILMVQDGQCGSTCAVFAEFMKDQGKVGTVAMGGRRKTGPMQGVGGVKGANVYTFDYLLDTAGEAFASAPKSMKKSLKDQWGTAIAGVSQAITRAQPDGEGAHNARVNVRNNIRKDDTSVTPLQFVYEAADCRLFYTAEQIRNQALVWKAAYGSYWNGDACVEGSTGQVSSKSGVQYILYGPDGKGPSMSSLSKDGEKDNAGSSLAVSGLTIALVVSALGLMLL